MLPDTKATVNGVKKQASARRESLRNPDRGRLILQRFATGADLVRQLLAFLFDLPQVAGADAVGDVDDFRVGTPRFASRANGDLQRELGLH